MRNFVFLILCASTALFANDGLKVISDPVLLIGGNDKYFMHPIWSPDGAQIAFTSAKYQGLWVMNHDGSGARQITDEPAAGFGFEWSSDSKAIVSRIAKFEGRYRYNAIKVFYLDKDESRLLTDYRTLMPGLPHWADSDEKVYMFGRGKLEVFNSGKTASSLQKSMQSKRILFLKNDHIAIGNIDTKEFNLIEPIKNRRYLNATISPDRSKVAFEVIGGDLYAMNVDGTGVVDLGEGHRPQWAPDSQRLVYMITEDDGHQFLASDIYSIRVDGMDKVRLTQTEYELEMNPSWSPNGKKIVYDVMGEGAIYMIELSE